MRYCLLRFSTWMAVLLIVCPLHDWHEFAEEEVTRFDFALTFCYNQIRLP